MENAVSIRERANARHPSSAASNNVSARLFGSKEFGCGPLFDSVNAVQRQGLSKLASRYLDIPAKALSNSAADSEPVDLAEVMAVLPAAVVVLNCQGRVVHCNGEAESLLDLELAGLLWREVISKRFRSRADDGHEVSLEDGRRVSLTTRSLGTELGQVILIKDLTSTRRLQEQLDRHRRLSDMGRMMSALAHQIRTPLAAAILHAGNLQLSRSADSSTNDYSGRILSRLHNIERQVKSMLRFAKGGTVPKQYCSLTELLSGLMVAGNELLASREDGKSVKYLWLNQAGETEILCDMDGVTGALLNLLENAIDASPAGTAIEICCSRSERTAADSMESRIGVEFAVIDQGSGPEPAVLPAGQEGFKTTKNNGTGLGLLIARTLAEAHDGDFSIANDPAIGTKAALWIPLALPSSSANSGEHK